MPPAELPVDTPQPASREGHVSSVPGARATRPDTLERVVVGAVYVAMTAGLLVYVYRFGRNLPYWDDWEVVPVLTGHVPFRMAWLWEAQNEHRMPFVRLLLYGLWRLTGDLRSVMVVTDLLLAASVLSLLSAVRSRRGRSSFTDAFLPLALLGWGMYENLIFAIQFFFISNAVLVLAITAAAIGEWRGRTWRVALMAVAATLLPLDGAIGLALSPGVICWTALAGFVRMREPDARSRRDAAMLLAGSAGSALGAIVMAATLPASASFASARSAKDMIRASCEVLSIGFGPVGARYWPWSGVIVTGIVAGCVVLAVAAVVRRRDDRLRSCAVLAAIGSLLTVVFAIGYGRAGFGPGQGFSDRYAIFSASLLAVGYVAASLSSLDGWGRSLRIVLLVVSVALFVPNARVGRVYGYDRADRADGVLDAIAAGAPIEAAAGRGAQRVYPVQEPLQVWLGMLRDRKAGPYAAEGAMESAVCRDAELSAVPIETNHLAVDGDRWRAFGDDPYLVYALPKPTYVSGVRIRFTITSLDRGPANLQIFWGLAGVRGFEQGRRSAIQPVSGEPVQQEVTFWIYDRLDRLRIDPDSRPCSVSIDGLTILVREPQP